ncbi:MAG: 16S rRNA methyltransferase [Candidatus Methanomethylicota archaeon]|uniref:16S rRNA methyltransferase n=1 Tax=Thermoproteota archaeon TaxID=2056631 RepID=A0A523BBX1_9CREN|nr:MAG: class I SAM-dependent methyltransferase [Candidatus Verstraetearchaeota archaeon]TDA38415.1 MAG: 16S rRNA methyltransferase [Candidatus Verstraetearchaeota archaeon]
MMNTIHYFTKQPIRHKYKISFEIEGAIINLLSSDGVFSKKYIDTGTKVLIESIVRKIPIYENAEILDLGCGYGVIGITIAKLNPKAKITMVDINPLAIKLTNENIKLNLVENAIVIRSHLYSQLENRKFDFIISNPPLAAGYKVIFPLIEGAKEHLKEGGRIIIVLRKGINAIPKKMKDVFGNVELLYKRAGYRVFQSIKTS